MKVRKATTSDVSAIVALNREVHSRHSEAFPEVFRANPSDEEVTEAFGAVIDAPSGCWFVASEDQTVIGYLSAEFREREETWCRTAQRVCYLGGIVVDPTFRRKGVARELVAALKREAAKRDTAQIELDVWEFNDDAQKAFADLGFEPLMQRMRLKLNIGGNRAKIIP